MRWWRRHAVSGDDLSTYLDGRLAEAGARRVEAHLEACEACRRRLEELKATVRLLRALPTAEVQRPFALRREAVLGPRPQPAPALRAYRYAGALSMVALAFFVALVAIDVASLGGGLELAGPDGTILSAPAAAPQEAAPAAPPVAPATAPAAAEAPDAEAGREGGQMAPVPTPSEKDFAAREPSAAAEEGEGAGAGRWVLRGFEAAVGALFLGGLFVTARRWQRQRRETAAS